MAAEQGERGDRGDRGTGGERGPKGDHGQPGDAGKQGEPGAAGVSTEGTSSHRFRIVMTCWMIVFTGLVIWGFHRESNLSKENKHNITVILATKTSNEHLTKQLNHLSVSGCVNSIPVYQKFNGLVQAIIDARTGQLNLAIQQHDAAAQAVHRAAIARYEKAFLPLPTKKSCQKLKPFGNQTTAGVRPN